MRFVDKLKKERGCILYFIFIILIILHSFYLVFQKNYVWLSFYFISIVLFFVKKRLIILTGLIPSLYLLLNPFPINKITYSSGALVKTIQALIATDPSTLGIALSNSLYPLLIIIVGVLCWLKNKKIALEKEGNKK